MVGESRRVLGLVTGGDAADGIAHSVTAGGTTSDNTRTDPPPKHKNNNEAQPRDICRENGASVASGSGASAPPAKSGSVAGYGRTTDVRQLGRAAHAERWLEALAPETLPPGVERIVSHAWTQWYRARLDQTLQVILEVECWHGELWAHLSVTGHDRMPTLAELAWCKDLFLRDRKAIQIFPSRAEAGARPRTLHLHAALESDALPSLHVSQPATVEGH